MLYIRTNIQNYAFYIIIIIHLVRDEFQNYVIINHLVIISQYIYIYIYIYCGGQKVEQISMVGFNLVTIRLLN